MPLFSGGFFGIRRGSAWHSRTRPRTAARCEQRLASTFLTLGALLSGCGGAPSASPEATPEQVVRGGRVELSLQTTDGEIVELSDQRGTPVLLALMATYDGASIASLPPLRDFALDHDEILVLAVLLQLDAEVFAREFVDAERPPYAVTTDPSGRLLGTDSPFGRLPVPSFVWLDAEGRVRDERSGHVTRRDLEEDLARLF